MEGKTDSPRAISSLWLEGGPCQIAWSKENLFLVAWNSGQILAAVCSPFPSRLARCHALSPGWYTRDFRSTELHRIHSLSPSNHHSIIAPCSSVPDLNRQHIIISVAFKLRIPLWPCIGWFTCCWPVIVLVCCGVTQSIAKPDSLSRNFPQSLLSNDGIVPQIRPLSLPSTSAVN
jgi:hypothetical protein